MVVDFQLRAKTLDSLQAVVMSHTITVIQEVHGTEELHALSAVRLGEDSQVALEEIDASRGAAPALRGAGLSAGCWRSLAVSWSGPHRGRKQK